VVAIVIVVRLLMLAVLPDLMATAAFHLSSFAAASTLSLLQRRAIALPPGRERQRLSWCDGSTYVRTLSTLGISSTIVICDMLSPKNARARADEVTRPAGAQPRAGSEK
jgi:hypothetical protein